MRILVTGIAGFVGSHLGERLLAEGHEVVGVDAFVDSYPESAKRRNLKPLLSMPAFSFHELDLRHDDLGPAMAGCDVVINEAAMAGLVRSWDEIELYAGCNVIAVGRLLHSAREHGIRHLIHASTSSVYGRDATGDEASPTHPVSPYGVTKLSAEHLIQAYVESFDFPATILRYFSVYGPRQRPDMAYHIFTEAILDGRPITVYGDGQQSRSNTYVADCVDATVRALERPGTGETFNVGGGEVITLLDAAQTIARLLDTELDVAYGPPRAGDQRETVADISKARSVLGYAPSVMPEEGLAAQVRWHQSMRVG